MWKYFFNFNWLFFDRLLKLFASLFVGIWVARYLGPSNFGIINYSAAFISFFAFLASGGIQQIAIRELVKYPEQFNAYLGTVSTIFFIGGALSVLVVYLCISFLKADDNLIVFMVFISSLIFIFQTFSVVDLYNQAKVNSKLTVIASNISLLVSVFLKILFIINEKTVIYFAFANTLDVLLMGLILVYFYKRSGNKVSEWYFDKKIALKIIKDSWPLAISMLLITIHQNIDKLMIEDMMAMSDVGLYSVSVTLSTFWLFLPTIVGNTLMPYFVKLRDSNRDQYHKMLMGLTSLLFYFSLLIAFFMSTFSFEIINILFGASYVDSAGALAWSVWGTVILSMGVPWSIWMISENLQIYRMYSQLINVIFNISLNLILIPKYGIVGASIATVLTFALGTLGLGMIFPRIRPATLMIWKSVFPGHAYKMLVYVNKKRLMEG